MLALPFVALLLAASPPKVDVGVDLYQAGKFAAAREALAPLADSPSLPALERARARAYLAASLCGERDIPGARREFMQLAKEFPEYLVSRADFTPRLVALADEARAEILAQAKPVTPEPKPLPPTEEPPPTPSDERTVFVRLGAFGFGEPVAGTLGAGASAGVSLYGVDLSARLLLGSNVGFGAEVAYRFRDGSLLQPRLAVRFSGVPGAGAWGGGAAAGLQLALTRNLWLGAEAGVEYFSVGAGYEPFTVPLALGIGAQF